MVGNHPLWHRLLSHLYGAVLIRTGSMSHGARCPANAMARLDSNVAPHDRVGSCTLTFSTHLGDDVTDSRTLRCREVHIALRALEHDDECGGCRAPGERARRTALPRGAR